MPKTATDVSWPRQILGALGNVFSALTAAVHQLTGH
jgi:hypothetical protein